MKNYAPRTIAVAASLSLMLAISFSFGCNKIVNVSTGNGVKGSGNVTKQQRSTAAFTGVDVGGVFQVDITVGSPASVEVEAEDNLQPLVKTNVDGSVLHIGTEKNISPTKDMRVHITVPSIDSIGASGVSSVDAAGIKGESLRIEVSGASKVLVSGEARHLNIEASGTSSVDAFNLNAFDAETQASGASSVGVNASGQLKTDASGASSIRYAGNPSNVDKQVSGASRVNPR